MSNFQRVGSISNSHVGREFEDAVHEYFHNEGLPLEFDFKVDCGISSQKKPHAFDLGSHDPALLVECKSQTWTSGGNVPSAKMKNWSEAMYYFHMAPPGFRKMFVALQCYRARGGESLLGYFGRTQFHLIPDDVELWEFDMNTHTASLVQDRLAPRPKG